MLFNYSKAALLSLFIVLSLFTGCAQRKAKPVVVKPVSIGQVEYQSLENLYQQKRYKEYLTSSSRFLSRHYGSSYEPNVLYRRGLIFLSSREYSDASKELVKIVDFFPHFSSYDLSTYYWAVSEYEQGYNDAAISAIEKIDTESQNVDPDIKVKALWLKGNILSDLDNKGKAIEAFIELSKITEDEAMKSKVLISVLTILDKTGIDELNNLASKYDGGSWNAYLLFELGERYMHLGGSRNDAKDKFEEFLDKFSEHEYRTQAESYLNKINNIDKVDPFTIGVILPLSGKNTPYGLKSLMGIQLAVNVFGKGSKDLKIPLRLAIVDSQSDPDMAKIAVDRLIEEDHVIAIIGSLSSDSAEVVSKQCAVVGIPNITLSQKENLTDLGEYVFSVAMNSSDQIKRLVSYAMEDLSIKKFGILYPEDNYGQKLTKYFWDEVLNRGGEITAIESYTPKQTDFSVELRKMVGIYHITPRRTEFRELKSLILEERGPEAECRDDEVKLPLIMDFEALFIPDDAKTVAQIAPYLAFYDVKDVILIGLNTWNSKQLIKRGGEHVEGAVFVDGFSAMHRFKESKIFVKNFKRTFNSIPGLLEAQAYDAAKILTTAMSKIFNDSGRYALNRDKLRGSISKLASFKGATGEISFDEDGNPRKKLFILGVEKEKIILRD